MKKNCDFMLRLAYIFTSLALGVGLYFVVVIAQAVTSYNQVQQEVMRQMKLGIGDILAGTVGMLLSFAATLFLFVTFREQRKQFSDSQFNAEKDRFESTFFNVLSMLYQVRDNVNREISVCSNQRLSGIKDFYNGFRFFCCNSLNKDKLQSINAILKKEEMNTVERESVESTLGGLYEEYLQDVNCTISYYYRYLFNMINFVVSQWEHVGQGSEYIHKYLNFIQAQMSDEELALVFYDVLSHYGLDKNYHSKFKEILDKYGFLENISPSFLLDKSHYLLFPNTCFKFLNRDERNKLRKD